MSNNFKDAARLITAVFQRLSGGIIAASAVALLVATGLSVAGIWPWPDLSLTVAGVEVPQAGMYVQIALAGLLTTLLFFLPTNARMLKLEASHRDFNIQMHDVTRAYALAHAADRAGAFQLSSEFDTVRERLVHMRSHPDLAGLEPEVLELAAQMSFVSHELAQTYSDERVNRARGFLRQRQQELADLNDRIEVAKQINSELQGWVKSIEMEESVAQSQLNRLRDDLADILPELDRLDAEARAERAPVYGISRAAAE